MAGIGNRNNDRDELSKFIKEAYDEFNSGFNKEKQDEEKDYGKIHYLCKASRCPGTIRDLKKHIAEIGLTNIENPADGDCFYFSIETYLKLIGLSKYNHLNLRQMVADELLGENIEVYANYIIADDPVQFLRDHEKDIRTPREWNNYLGELPSMILPKLLGYNLKIYTLSIQTKRKKDKEGRNIKNKNGEIVFIPDYKYFSESSINVEGEAKGTIYILNTGNHYEALIPTDLLGIPEVDSRISEILSEQFKSANIKKEKSSRKKVTIKKQKTPNSNNSNVEKLTMNFKKWEKLTRPNSKTRKSSRLAAKRSNASIALLKAARAGPGSNSESNSNNNSKPAGGAGKKKNNTVKKLKNEPELTNNQLIKYRFYKNAGINENTARALAISE